MAARQMVSVENALRVAMAEAQQGCRPRKQRVSCSNLASVLGCVLAEPVYSPSAVPAYRASIKDGYAIPMPVRVGRADDEGLLPLRVLGTARAGEQPHTGSAGDQNQNGVASAASDEAVCWYVSTGGALPDGADAVLMVEHVQRTVEGDDGDTHILVSQDAISALRPGQDVRQVGSDIAQGELLLEAGTRVGEVEMGVLAMCGVSSVDVFRAPKVAVLSTGDEIIEPFTQAGAMRPGQVRDANRIMLVSMCARVLNVSVDNIVDLGIVVDDRERLLRRVRGMLEDDGIDVAICSGGVSMGDKDYVKGVLEELGTVHFGKVLMKPGKPLTFATLQTEEQPAQAEAGGCPPRKMFFFGLPGNPVSSAVTFNLIVAPVLRELVAGPQARRFDPGSDASAVGMCHQRVHARLAQRLDLDPARPEYHRATLVWAAETGSSGTGCWRANSTGNQISSKLTNMLGASVLIELPQGGQRGAQGTVHDHLPEGAWVSCILIGSWPENVNSHESGVNRQAEQHPGGSVVRSGVCERVRIGVLTISDRASSGAYEDISGPAIISYMNDILASAPADATQQGGDDSAAHEFSYRIIPDEQHVIESALIDLCDSARCDIVVTTGGTGPAKRDVTPEATKNVCDKILDGFGELMRATSLQVVPTAILSRQLAGTRGSTLIINCPGKPKSISECLDAVMPAVPYCVDLIEGRRIEFAEGKVKAFRPKQKS